MPLQTRAVRRSRGLSVFRLKPETDWERVFLFFVFEAHPASPIPHPTTTASHAAFDRAGRAHRSPPYCGLQSFGVMTASRASTFLVELAAAFVAAPSVFF